MEDLFEAEVSFTFGIRAAQSVPRVWTVSGGFPGPRDGFSPHRSIVGRWEL